jgi:hypothetical protein
MHNSQKGCHTLGVPRGNAAPLLQQLKEGIFDQMPKTALFYPI